MRVLVTRAEPGASAMAERLAALGHVALLAPMLTVQFHPLRLADTRALQAIVVTSGNALRALERSEVLAMLRDLPIYAVGAVTAEWARTIGFTDIHVGPGNAEGLLPVLTRELDPSAGRILHLVGETVAMDLKDALERAGFTVDQSIVYRTDPVAELPAEIIAAFSAGAIDAVTLMSRKTAECYAALIDRHGLAGHIRRVRHLCLSPAVAAGLAHLGDIDIAIARAPRLEEMLALLNCGAAQSRPNCT